jgi:hypothetical protein
MSKNYFSEFMGQFQPIVTKNFEAMVAANQVILDSVQAIARREAEVVQEMVQNTASCMKSCATGSQEESRKKGVEQFQGMMRNMQETAREMMEIAAKASMEVFDIGCKRCSEVMHDCSSQMAQAQKASK